MVNKTISVNFIAEKPPRLNFDYDFKFLGKSNLFEKKC